MRYPRNARRNHRMILDRARRAGSGPYRRTVRPVVHANAPERGLHGLARAVATRFERQGYELRGIISSRASMTPRVEAALALANEGSPLLVATFQLPLNDNAGRWFPTHVVAGVLVDVTTFAGGLTLRPGLGFCRSGVIRWDVDAHVELEVWTTDEGGLLALVEQARARLDQDSIIVKITRPQLVEVARPAVRP